MNTRLEKELRARYLVSDKFSGGALAGLVEEGQLSAETKISLMTYTEFKHLVGSGVSVQLPHNMVVLMDDESKRTIDREVAQGLISTFVKDKQPASVKMIAFAPALRTPPPQNVLKSFSIRDPDDIHTFTSNYATSPRTSDVITGSFTDGAFYQQSIQMATQCI
ncbi:hypothetical protein UCRPA7_2537 [Phaeoacremonium minimum UCRPA7]|uniref:Uncharacterized protein n=1 Tax=Phaeoacremonium minimum (strain UCR-PA7) TaxID=1286976 RepID=R8BRE5_PHAM7|nr:hypothetical protein UCRPA7_2537 [Phaeoacremonium minimum UCRPA7]EOO01947.1 hypothetical protein UCRPA7_2537 [Phaeoacremonium minimum UCRPA7]